MSFIECSSHFYKPEPKSYLFGDVFERGRAEPLFVGRRGHEQQDGKGIPGGPDVVRCGVGGGVKGGHVIDVPAQSDLSVVEVLEGGVAQQLESHSVGLRLWIVDEGCDSPRLE